jgi:hypothetical protein
MEPGFGTCHAPSSTGRCILGVPARAADDKAGNVLSVSGGGGGGDRVVVIVVGLRCGVMVRGDGLGHDCSSILVLWIGGGRWDAGVDRDTGVGTVRARVRLLDDGAGPGSPGSATELFSMARQSIQASRCCDQARQSWPRSVLNPACWRKHLLVTSTIPLRQRVRATFIRGCEFKNPGCCVLTEDKIT